MLNDVLYLVFSVPVWTMLGVWIVDYLGGE